MQGVENGKNRGDIQKALWIVATATAILFLFSVGVGVFAYIVNNHRINDIQQSRVISCQRTYNAFHQVFKPFIPPAKDQSAAQKHDIAKFNETVDRLVRNCINQTSVGH